MRGASPPSADVILLTSTDALTTVAESEGEFKGKYFGRYLHDEDENGEYEEVCFDVDLDEQIDHCRGIS